MALREKSIIGQRFLALIAGLTVLCGLAVGCDRTPRGSLPRGDITVTITHGGDTVAEGRVDLNNNQTGEGGGGELNGQGIAAISQVVEGAYVVTVNPPFRGPVAAQPAKEFPNIPQKFRKVASSPLKADVKRGESVEYRFDLKELE